jgi:hypothetical protein
MIAELEAGQRITADGADNPGRLTRHTAIAVADAHARFYDAVQRGNCYMASQQAAAAVGTALTATAVTLTLFNPQNSPNRLVVILGQLAVVTATVAGFVVWAVNSIAGQAAPTATTPLASGVQNALIGGGAANQGVVFSAATLPTVPVARRVMCGILGTTPTQVNQVNDFVDGLITLMPGMMVTLQGVTTNATGVFSLAWEEITP